MSSAAISAARAGSPFVKAAMNASTVSSGVIVPSSRRQADTTTAVHRSSFEPEQKRDGVVASGRTFSNAPRSFPPDRAGGGEVALVLAEVVLAEVVSAASELEVGEVGFAVSGPVGDVVAVAVLGGEGAAGFDAAAVADAQG